MDGNAMEVRLDVLERAQYDHKNKTSEGIALTPNPLTIADVEKPDLLWIEHI